MRTSALIAGPPIIFAVCYALAMPDAARPGVSFLKSVETGAFDSRKAADRAKHSLSRRRPSIGTRPPTAELAAACRERATEINLDLAADCRVIVRPPFVLGGDFAEDELERYHRLLIRPIVRALSVSYFDRPPDRPIVVLLFSGEEPFHRHARRFDRRSPAGNYGYYQREDRRLMIDASTGNGTLAHELTHALAHFDFPAAPAWFDEGLASLHEESEFTDDGLGLTGLSNWRLNLLVEAIEQSRLPPLESLIGRPIDDRRLTAAEYAQARYFCLYLQSRRLLRPYYRKLRQSAATDPTGERTLYRLLQIESTAALDSDFRDWVMALRDRRAD